MVHRLPGAREHVRPARSEGQLRLDLDHLDHRGGRGRRRGPRPTRRAACHRRGRVGRALLQRLRGGLRGRVDDRAHVRQPATTLEERWGQTWAGGPIQASPADLGEQTVTATCSGPGGTWTYPPVAISVVEGGDHGAPTPGLPVWTGCPQDERYASCPSSYSPTPSPTPSPTSRAPEHRPLIRSVGVDDHHRREVGLRRPVFVAGEAVVDREQVVLEPLPGALGGLLGEQVRRDG